MKGHKIAENLRNSKHRFTTCQLHKVVDGEDAFCTLGLKALEAGIPIRRLDETWDCTGPLAEVVKVYQINDNYANKGITYDMSWQLSTLQLENLQKNNVIKAFDSPKWRDFDFPIEAFIEYLRNTTATV